MHSPQGLSDLCCQCHCPAGGRAPSLNAAGDVGSPNASMLAAGPRGSDGTARATIVAGPACSILTTAAAGDVEGMEEGGEALSPLHTMKTAALKAAAEAAANTGTVLATGAVSGSVEGGQLGIAVPRGKSRTGQQQPLHGELTNGEPLPSTLAVDLELVGSPLAMASGQPSMLPQVPGQAMDGTEVQQEVAQLVNGHAAHAHSVIGHSNSAGAVKLGVGLAELDGCVGALCLNAAAVVFCT